MPKLIRNTYAGWVSSNPILALEDTGFERDTGRSKIGDGVKAWNDMNYFNEAPAGGGGRLSTAPVEFGDPVTARLRYEIVPAGGTQEVFYDDYSTDTLDDVTRYPAGRGTATVGSGIVTASSDATLLMGPKMEEGRSVTMHAPSPDPMSIVLVKGADGSELRCGRRATNNWGKFWFVSSTGVVTELVGNINTVDSGYHWLRASRNGPVVPASGGLLEVALTQAMIDVLGGSTYAGLWIDSVSGVSLVRIKKILSEQRRLVADIDHPAGGVISTVIASS
jgi:hypothetical protein